MAHYAYLFLFLSLLNIAIAKDCTIQDPEIVAWEKKLRKDIKKDLEIFRPPTKKCNEPIEITLRFAMKYFAFDSIAESFTVQTLMHMSWQDERLKWKPENYGGINETEISSAYIWTPIFRLNNTVDSNDYDRFFFVPCSLKSSGEVRCSDRSIHDVRCPVNLTNWPHDVQDCSLEFDVWSTYTTNSTFKLKVARHAMAMFGAEYGAEWYISDYRQEMNTEQNLKMVFTLVREAAVLSSILIYPSLILTSITVATLFLDVRGLVRVGLVCFSMMAHYDFLTEFAWNVPNQSHNPPTLLLFYRGSMILTIMSLLFSLLLSSMCKKDTVPHNIIYTVNSFIFDRYGKFYILPHWHSDVDTSDVTESVKFNQDWLKFSNFVNWVFAAIVIVTYVCLYVSLVPQPVAENY